MYKEFNNFVKEYNLKNKAVRRKFHHTYRVVKIAKDIAKSINLSKDDVNLAMKCALLHDIARFSQTDEYDTFDDMHSFDHGDMGATILEKNDYISKYTKNKEEQQIIIKAVRNHNKKEIEKNLTQRELLFVNITRDADKLDILVLLNNDTLEETYKVDENLIKTIKEKKPADYFYVGNPADKMILIICFIYDLNFKYSYEFIKRKKLIKRKIDMLYQHVPNLNIKEEVLAYIDNKIKE